MTAEAPQPSVVAMTDVQPTTLAASVPSPPLPGLTTTEAVVRALKSTGNSYDERLAVAVWLWSDATLVFPRRREFLLEWCTTAMLRFAGKRGASTVGTPCDHVGFWRFMLAMLCETRQTTGGAGNATEVATGTDTPEKASGAAALAAVRTPLVPLISGALRAVNDRLTAADAEESNSASLCSLMEVVLACLRLLVEAPFNRVFQPALEQWIDCALHALLAWSIAKSHQETMLLDSISYVASTALSEFSKLCRSQTNQRKIFITVTEKLLRSLLSVRAQAVHAGDDGSGARSTAAQSQLVHSIDQTLRRGLFHQEHLADFGTVLHALNAEKSSTTRNIASYQKQLFDQLRVLAADQTSAPKALAAFSVLFRLFIDESRRRQRVLEASRTATVSYSQSGEQHELVARQLEFSFFSELHRICSTCATVSPADALTVDGALLKVLAQMDVYRASNEAVFTQQHAFFSDIAEQRVADLSKPEKADSQSALFDTLRTILVIDFSILETRLDRILPHVLLPRAEGQTAARMFVAELLATFVKSRRLDAFTQHLLAALESWSCNSDAELCSTPLLADAFTIVFEKQIRNVPAAQLSGVLDLICSALVEYYLPAVPPTADSEHKKRRKLDPAGTKSRLGKNVDSLCRSMQLLTMLLSLIVRMLPVSAMADDGEDPFGLVAKLLYLGKSFILPALERSHDSQHAAISASRYALLQLHTDLVSVCRTYWRECRSPQVGHDQLISDLRSATVKQDSRTCLVLCNLALQLASNHVFERGANVQTADTAALAEGKLVTALLDTIDHHWNAADNMSTLAMGMQSWDGRLVSLTQEALPGALLLLVFSEWFSLISNHASDQQLECLLGVLLASDQQLSKGDGVLAGMLHRLMCASWFFELPRVRDMLLPLQLRMLANTASTAIKAGKKAPAVYRQIQEALAQLTRRDKPVVPEESVAVCDGLQTNVARRCILLCRRLYLELLVEFPNAADLRLKDVEVLRWMMDTLPSTNSVSSEMLHTERMLVNTTKRIVSLTLSWQIRATKKPDSFAAGANLVCRIITDLQKQVEATFAAGRAPNQQDDCNTAGPMDIRAILFAEDVLGTFAAAGLVLPKASNDALKRVHETVRQLAGMCVAEANHALHFHLAAVQASAGKSMLAMSVLQHLGPVFDLLGTALTCRRRMTLSEYATSAAAEQGLSMTLVLDYLARACGLLTDDATAPRMRGFVHYTAARLLEIALASAADTADGLSDAGMRQLLAALWLLVARAPAVAQDVLNATLDASAQDITFAAHDAHASVEVLAVAFADFAARLPRTQFRLLVDAVLDGLDAVAREVTAGDQTTHQHQRWAMLYLLRVAFDAKCEASRQRLRHHASQVLARLPGLLQIATSSREILQALALMYQICSYKLIVLRQSDLALCLQALTVVASPSMAQCIDAAETAAGVSPWDACEWLLTQAAVVAPAGEAADADTVTTAEAIFTAVYRVLLDITRHHREALLDVVPAYMAQVRNLLHCLRAPRPAATADQLAQLRAQLPFPLVSRHMPLPTTCAVRVARLLSALVDRGAVQAGGPISAAPAMSGAGRDGAVTAAGHTLRALGKHAPYLLGEWLRVDTEPASRLTAATRTALLPGVYALLDLCTEHERDHLLSMAGHAEGARLKDVYRSYMAHHKYTGKA
ncbi:Urb2/Npa2 family-domain-containing protein [Thamnocephalis sphaerospora]|uniref:Urb2/Npa2 family-domain-containing protein n=1 Tax=Thamnocephalis sphaerospora TaxID=78915 RepID=A0A4P9XSF9_9FUNG|nr:Urb2/Npa2 family-domain-containing protein [Thamnocephalis sphaerospora]|eukprot:RKP09057.1 Urb2/Npa2 family-domain-containing protein [Thamnocephalis sphaerospora]